MRPFDAAKGCSSFGNLTLQQMLDAGAVLAAAGRGEEGNAFGSLAGLL
jgi:hypothetical protein